ncbi:hypothetical protein [Erythrobacter aureus]|uniref:Uncharacterized protein n=1 Tax=Erythrobacter aureus TaxID=2182384 RepID=A0A345YIS3_9SPHN|nr:hypothetical protein [Erythrobacter aureus]AXK43825.1 hypothetical protein DVR09_15325 [Erythrobacter aureus]
MDEIPQTISTKDVLTALAAHLMQTEECTQEQALDDVLSILGFCEAVDGHGIYDAVIQELS